MGRGKSDKYYDIDKVPITHELPTFIVRLWCKECEDFVLTQPFTNETTIDVLQAFRRSHARISHNWIPKGGDSAIQVEKLNTEGISGG